jgi:hypothetical protein
LVTWNSLAHAMPDVRSITMSFASALSLNGPFHFSFASYTQSPTRPSNIARALLKMRSNVA